MHPDLTAAHVAAIYNAAWWVRYWSRPHQQKKKAEALERLGLTAKAAFSAATENFAPLLYAIARGIAERD